MIESRPLASRAQLVLVAVSTNSPAKGKQPSVQKASPSSVVDAEVECCTHCERGIDHETNLSNHVESKQDRGRFALKPRGQRTVLSLFLAAEATPSSQIVFVRSPAKVSFAAGLTDSIHVGVC